jgi:hypothetical protein
MHRDISPPPWAAVLVKLLSETVPRARLRRTAVREVEGFDFSYGDKVRDYTLQYCILWSCVFFFLASTYFK